MPDKYSAVGECIENARSGASNKTSCRDRGTRKSGIHSNVHRRLAASFPIFSLTHVAGKQAFCSRRPRRWSSTYCYVRHGCSGQIWRAGVRCTVHSSTASERASSSPLPLPPPPHKTSERANVRACIDQLFSQIRHSSPAGYCSLARSLLPPTPTTPLVTSHSSAPPPLLRSFVRSFAAAPSVSAVVVVLNDSVLLRLLVS